MFIETCIVCCGLAYGQKLYNKIKDVLDTVESDHEVRASPEKAGQNEKNALITAASALEQRYHIFIEKKIDPLFGNTRDQQLKSLSHSSELSEQEKEANIRIGIASLNLILGVACKALYPQLIIITVPGILLASYAYFKGAFNSIFKEKRISISVLDALLTTLAILSGYFFAGVVGIFLVSISSKLVAKTRDNSQRQLANIFTQHSNSVWILLEDGTEFEIPFEQLQTGDIVVVNPGEIIPVDGTVISGIASVDQRALTGESQPAEKETGDKVFASTIVLTGKISIQAEQTGEQTVAAKIRDILNHTTDYKTSFEIKAQQLVDRSVIPTLGLSALALFTVGTSGALAILYCSVGYVMRIFGPLSTLNFLRITSNNSILVKDGSALEGLTAVDTIVFDKTGTLTIEQSHVGKIYSCNGFSEDMLLAYSAAAEYRQTHPIAKSILEAANERRLSLPEIEDACYEIGYGVKVSIDGKNIKVGSRRFMEMERLEIPPDMVSAEEHCGNKGYSLIMIAVDDAVSGAIELRPTARPEAKQLICNLRQRNISTYIISGDQEEPTRLLSEELKIDHYVANALPEHKSEIIEQLKKDGKTVCFVGDGINDSVALKKADVSISFHDATMIAADTAQVILMDNNLLHIDRLLDIAGKFEKSQKINMAISIIPGIICIGGVFLIHIGIYSSMVLFFGSLGVGIGNAMHPLVQAGRSKADKSAICTGLENRA